MKRPSTRRTLWRRLLAAVSAVLILLGVGAVVTGRVGYVVTNGVSMEPLYHTGDLVVIAKASSYHVGEIVAYHGDLEGHLVVLHRIVGGNASGFTMKGDNNKSIDPLRPTASQVIGRAILHIPKVGLFLTSPIVRALLVLLIVVLWASLAFEPRRRSSVRSPGPLGSSPGRQVVSPLLQSPGPRTWGGTVRPLLRSSGAAPAFARPAAGLGVPGGVNPPPLVAGTGRVGRGRAPAAWQMLAGLDVLLGVALALSLLVGSSRAAPEPPAFTQTGVLTYHARPPASATYPSGHIVTGDPVFLKLVDRLGISFFYSTDAPASSVLGNARLDAVVSAASGWQISLPLVNATPLTAGHADLTTTLNLGQILAVANRVSTATEVFTGTLVVTVTGVATVSFDGAKPVTYKVRLPLSLSALELSMSGGTLTPTAFGPAIASTVALNKVPTPAQPSSVPHEIRLGMLGALLLLIAATIVVIPTGEGEDGREPHKG